jgi:hypothetical protein
MPAFQACQLEAAHNAFQWRCEQNTAWYTVQLEDACLASASGLPTEAPANEPLTVFHSKFLPNLSLFELSTALGRASKCGSEELLIALVLMCRYVATTRTRVTAHMMHRLYVVCLQMAMKAHSDVYYRNDAFARLAGITFLELNRLEAALITALNWSLQVTREEIELMALRPRAAMSHTSAAAVFDAQL